MTQEVAQEAFPSPNTPPGFVVANIGRQLQGEVQITIQTDGSWQKKTNLGCAAWVIMHLTSMQGKGQGTISHGHSTLLMEARACLQAVEWVRQQQIRRVTI